MLTLKATARVAADLIMLLQREGFTIQRYDSKTTSSIYLKLDYGVCNSIRIGDHKGKKKYKYRYNVDIGRKQINRHMTPEGMERRYYPETALWDLYLDVVEDRQKIKDKHGEAYYQLLMAQYELEGRGTKGFWESAKLVSPDNQGGASVDYEINEKAREALNKLTSLPGMHAIKEQVDQMVHFSRIAALRNKNKLKTQIQSNHMIFTGNPGTGKTTAARLIGEAFAEIGLLKRRGTKVPFVEIHHSTIAAGIVGESEKNIVSKFESARGGVLFIDEAYSFCSSGSSHRTEEKVIAAMVQCIEDMRDEVVVIAAGYPEDMKEFVNSNPGLASRFPTTIHFPDYAVPELVQIAYQMCIDQEYQPDNGYLDALASVMWIEKIKRNFGNARAVRNHVERSIRKQSMRVSQMQSPTRKDLATLIAADLVHSVDGLQNAELEVLQKLVKDASARIFELDLKGIAQKGQGIV